MSTWQDRLRDARNFLTVAQATADPEYGNQAASNAILAAIAANDAICIRLGGASPAGNSHIEAADVLVRVCRATRWEGEAGRRARQLAGVLHLKAAAQYGGRPLSAAEVGRVMRQAERFIEWAEEVLASG